MTTKHHLHMWPIGDVEYTFTSIKTENGSISRIQADFSDLAIIVHVDSAALNGDDLARILSAYNAVLRYCHQQQTPSAFGVMRMADMLANHQATIAAAYKPVDELRRKYAEAKRDGKDSKALKTLETRGANARAKADNDTRRIRFEAAVIAAWLEAVAGSERMAA